MLLLDFGRFGNRDLVTSKGIFLAFLEFWKEYFQGIGVTFCLTGTERMAFEFYAFCLLMVLLAVLENHTYKALVFSF